jgi:hypothetical protein
MVKLVRLASQDTTGLFNNLFNDDVTLKKDSKVALHSMTCEISSEQVTIDALNDTLYSKYTDSSAFKECHLEHGTYNATNFPDLLNDVTFKLNSSSLNNATDIGKQWNASIVKSTKKIDLVCKYGTYITPDDPGCTALVGSVNVSQVIAKTYARDGGTPTTDDAYMWFKAPNCKGSSNFASSIQQTTKTGYVMSYLAEAPNATTGVIDPATILYGIRHSGTIAASGVQTDPIPHYKFIIKGVESTHPTYFPEVGDYITLGTGRGKIIGYVVRGNATLTLFTESYDHTTDLFPVLIFNGDNDSRAKDIRFNSDPFYTGSTLETAPEYVDPDGLSAPPPGKPSSTASIKSIKFGDIDLAIIMGYNKTEYSSEPTTTETHFTSDKTFSMSDLADSFVVELINIPLDSYDGLTSQRRNILHTIVQTDTIRERLTYTAPYPLYIDLKNANNILLRNIQARILREDLSAVNISGFSQITLLISE